MYKVSSQYKGKIIFPVATSCTRNVSSSKAMDMDALPSLIKGLSSAPETVNGMGCSGGTEENK